MSVILDQPLLARLQPPAAAAAVAGEHAGPAVAPQGPREAPAHTPAETLHAFLDYRERQAAAGRNEAAGATAAASGADEDTPAGAPTLERWYLMLRHTTHLLRVDRRIGRAS